jgi:hypothetical protein
MTHPIVGCAHAIELALSQVAELNPIYMSPADQADALLLVQRDLNRLAELQLRLLAAADDMAARDGARDPAGWIAHRARLDRRDARRRQRLARSLDTKWHRVREALRDGHLTTDQAAVVCRALEELPGDLDPALVEKAEKHLTGCAADHDPRELRALGRKVLEVLDPDAADEHEGELLAKQERQARKKTWLTFRNAGDGTTYVKGRLPTPIADRLRRYLDSIASPRRPDNRHGDSSVGSADTGTTRSAGHTSDSEAPTSGATPTPTSTPDRSPYDVRLGRAFCSLLEHWDPSRLPIQGGAATTVTITIDLEALRRGLGVATTDTGEVITAAEARRLACTAGLLPAVLGSDSEVLDLGRTSRLFSPAQRRAMALRDKTCRAEGCDTPAAWCEAHHANEPWSNGGRTDLEDGALLCSWHHHRAHDPDYNHQRPPNGDFRFHRRT